MREYSSGAPGIRPVSKGPNAACYTRLVSLISSSSTHDREPRPGADPAPAAEAPKPKLVVGWIVAADLRDVELLDAYDQARAQLKAQLEAQFPMFDWQMPQAERRSFAPRGSLRPLNLLEIGGEEKLHRRWDYALVVVPNELEPRRRISTLGVPSSALEVAVMSSARLGHKSLLPERLAALAQHLLGHLFTLDTRDEGPMRSPEVESLELLPFPEDQAEEVEDVLHDVTDARLEETKRTWNTITFYIRAFYEDWWGIAKSVWGYRPWRIPLYLGRLTAAVAVTLLVLLITAESWEAGSHMNPLLLVPLTVGAVVLATVFIYIGQHLDQVGRGRGWSEQLARSRIVLFFTLMVGMVSLWAAMFALLYASSWVFPLEVTSAWAGFAPEEFPRFRFVAFLSTIGLLAAALGGNIEEEDAIKAELFFDEEV